ncbi:MAG: STAS/SEC14 domain-containing protein [Halobacteriovoraceae bacterium]|nr:STAS/SEC14 domain-containing protein [Halobacteriovoraceae bacterium]
MLKKIPTPHQDIVAFSAVGTLTKEDYTENIVPLIQDARKKGEKIKFLFQFGTEFENFSPAAAWEDFKLGVHYLETFSRIAVVTDTPWLKNLSTFFGHAIPCTVKGFKNNELEDAMAWLNSGEIGFNFKINEQEQYVQVEIKAPLTSDNFYLLSHAVDRWLELGNNLKGLVIHTQKFPGWEDFGSFVSHIEFIKDHHKKLDKVALVADSEFLDFATQLGSHFVDAEVKHFPYDELSKAQQWITNP